MSNITAQGQAQLAGVSHLFFIEHRLVRRWPRSHAGKLAGAHVLAPTAAFQQLEGTTYTATLDAEAGDTPHGTSYNQVVEGFYAGDGPGEGSKLAAMHGRRYLVLVRYLNGSVVAIGDAMAGLLFTSKYASGKKPGERKGHTWRFEAATPTPAAYLTEPFTVEALGQVAPGQVLPPGPQSPFVLVRTRSGRVLAAAVGGQVVELTSDFKVTVKIK